MVKQGPNFMLRITNKKKYFRLYSWFVLIMVSFANQAIFSTTEIEKTKTPKRIIRTITYKHLSKDEIKDVKSLFPLLQISINKNQQSIQVIGNKKSLNRLAYFLKKLDKQRRSIELSATIIELSHNNLNKMGIEWDIGQIKTINLSSAIFNKLALLVKEGKANLLANPKVLTLENKEAEVRIGNKVPYVVPINTGSQLSWQLQYLDAGISLEITSQIISDNIIVSDINAEISSIKQWKATVSGEYPVISSRKIVLNCQSKDGNSLVIGGLINNQERINTNKIPFLSDLPLVGGFFTTTTKEEDQTEVMFIITPRIITI